MASKGRWEAQHLRQAVCRTDSRLSASLAQEGPTSAALLLPLHASAAELRTRWANCCHGDAI